MGGIAINLLFDLFDIIAISYSNFLFCSQYSLKIPLICGCFTAIICGVGLLQHLLGIMVILINFIIVQ